MRNLRLPGLKIPKQSNDRKVEQVPSKPAVRWYILLPDFARLVLFACIDTSRQHLTESSTKN